VKMPTYQVNAEGLVYRPVKPKTRKDMFTGQCAACAHSLRAMSLKAIDAALHEHHAMVHKERVEESN
jgi:hypothetical protein